MKMKNVGCYDKSTMKSKYIQTMSTSSDSFNENCNTTSTRHTQQTMYVLAKQGRRRVGNMSTEPLLRCSIC